MRNALIQRRLFFRTVELIINVYIGSVDFGVLHEYYGYSYVPVLREYLRSVLMCQLFLRELFSRIESALVHVPSVRENNRRTKAHLYMCHLYAKTIRVLLAHVVVRFYYAKTIRVSNGALVHVPRYTRKQSAYKWHTEWRAFVRRLFSRNDFVN